MGRRPTHISLCRNRPEDFGPLSQRYSHILTSCFLDTILVPLCSWLYLIAAFILIVYLTPIGLRSRFRSKDTPYDNFRPRHGKSYKIFNAAYYILIIAQICMCTLEIVRLSLANYGIGLLPFTYATLLLATALHVNRRMDDEVKGVKALNIFVFLALMITNGVKIAGETKEGVGTRKETKYPMSDQIIDVAVMIGVYLALAILEAVT